MIFLSGPVLYRAVRFFVRLTDVAELADELPCSKILEISCYVRSRRNAAHPRGDKPARKALLCICGRAELDSKQPWMCGDICLASMSVGRRRLHVRDRGIEGEEGVVGRHDR